MICKGLVDLHLHSESSDGDMPVYTIAPAAKRLGLSAICKTDHDSTNGNMVIAESLKDSSIEYIQGAELDTAENIHVLGYYIDPNHPAMKAYCAREWEYGGRLLDHNVRTWVERNGRIPFDAQDLIAKVKSYRNNGGVILRHIADLLTGYGIYPDPMTGLEDARRCIEGSSPPVNHPPSAAEATRVIMETGGVAIYAHPQPDELEAVEKLIKAGAVGVGGLNVKTLSAETCAYWRNYCEKKELVLTGGTDWHGPVEFWNVTRRTVTAYAAVEELKEAVLRIHGRSV